MSNYTIKYNNGEKLTVDADSYEVAHLADDPAEELVLRFITGGNIIASFKIKPINWAGLTSAITEV